MGLSDKLSSDEIVDSEFVPVCPVCDCTESTFLWWAVDRVFHVPGKFANVKCVDCGLIRLSPRPTIDTIGRYYPNNYGAYAIPEFSISTVNKRNKFGLRNRIREIVLSDLGYKFESVGSISKLVQPLLKRMFFEQATYGYGKRFPHYVKNGRALEVGCGNGAFLSYLKHHGWKVQGVDLSPHAAHQANLLFGIDVFVGQLEDVDFELETFDYVHLSHVLEHFFDPLSSMTRVCNLMKPGARIYVEVPNSLSYAAELSGEFWYGWDSPRHLYTFSPENLKSLLTRAGLEVLEMKSVLSNFFPWEDTFRQEELSGTKSPVRPSPIVTEKSRIQAKLAIQEFARDDMSGDFISCWGRKPAK